MALNRQLLCLALLVGLVLCGLWIPAPVGAMPRANAAITVLSSEHSYVFGEQIRFHLQAEADRPIESIVLSYRTLDGPNTSVVDLSFEPRRAVDVEHVHQVSERYIRPFVEISYWWTIGGAEGSEFTTDPQSFEYVDDRFPWQSLGEGGAAVHWYERGDQPAAVDVAAEVLNVAVEAIARAALDIPVEALGKTIDIYLYAHPDDLRLALPAGLPSGAEALTLYETNVIVIPYGPEAAHIPALQRIVPHEVTHALIHEATRSDYDRVPLWLAEGLATSVEHTFVPDPGAEALLNGALARRELLRLETLCAAFPHGDPDARRLAYAQSASVIDAIRDLYGRRALRDLIAAYADGATCEGGVQRVFDISLERLELVWREYKAPQGRLSLFWEQNASLIVLALFLSAPVLFVLPWPRWLRQDVGKDTQ
jgi:hypothetical protein